MNRKKWSCVLSLNLILGAGLIVLLSKPHQEPDHISERLNDIQAQIVTLQHSIKSPAENIDLDSIQQTLNRLTTQLDELKPNDTEQLNQLVMNSQSQLTSKLEAMQTVIASLDQKQHPVKYLSPTALPFKVISIDNIQQVSVASVEYDFKTIPLEQRDALAGWTVLSINFAQQSIELENGNKEHVIVALENGEHHA